MNKRALIVEDQTTLRELLGELLGASYAVESCATAAEARSLLAVHHYDLVLLDLVLPDAHGSELLGELRKLHRTPRTVILTAHARASVVRDVMERGARAVISKSAPLRELREGIDRASAGGFYYCSETSRLLSEAVHSGAPAAPLTDRQRQILRAVASGMSSKEIASALSLSEKTVANHRARIMERLGVHDVAGLTRYALSLGLVDPSQ
ncbi:MAG: Two component transcriptional regulator, LuxR family [Myxococcaceae bacterium]|nr:Two component transcriptional regulator, LuxR family [Myxococcaceae bacterium]